MKRMLVLTLATWAMHAGAAVPYDDKMIVAIAKRTHSTRVEVVESLENGCASGITPSMRECAEYHAVAADIELNTVYQKLLGKLQGTHGKERLPKAQRAWRAFRDANCAFEASSWEGGTGHGITLSACETRMTQHRTKELENYVRCDDAGCPGSD